MQINDYRVNKILILVMKMKTMKEILSLYAQ